MTLTEAEMKQLIDLVMVDSAPYQKRWGAAGKDEFVKLVKALPLEQQRAIAADLLATQSSDTASRPFPSPTTNFWSGEDFFELPRFINNAPQGAFAMPEPMMPPNGIPGFKAQRIVQLPLDSDDDTPPAHQDYRSFAPPRSSVPSFQPSRTQPFGAGSSAVSGQASQVPSTGSSKLRERPRDEPREDWVNVTMSGKVGPGRAGMLLGQHVTFGKTASWKPGEKAECLRMVLEEGGQLHLLISIDEIKPYINDDPAEDDNWINQTLEAYKQSASQTSAGLRPAAPPPDPNKGMASSGNARDATRGRKESKWRQRSAGHQRRCPRAR